jgi:hypothetical protein
VSGSAGRGDARRFTPTSGTAAGWAGIVIAVFVLVVVLSDDRSVGSFRFSFVVGLFGLLVWCYMLRPRVVIGTSEVELRNAFSSWHVPLAEVRRVSVRAVTRVHTDERRFDGVAVGRPVRSLRPGRTERKRPVGLPGLGATYAMNNDPTPTRPSSDLDADGVADFVTEQILLAADRARAEHAAGRAARRSWASLELVALVLLVGGLAVSLFL